MASTFSTRLKIEMELLLNQEPWEIALKNLQSWGGLFLFDMYFDMCESFWGSDL